MWSLSANLVYHFLVKSFTPYVTGGLGAIGASVDAPGDEDINESDTRLAWNFGGGVKTVMSERVGVRGDLRFFNGSELVPDHWRVYAGLVFRLGR
jgi:opacity protein-like surface antigen